MQVLLARVGAGKTAAVQERLLALKREHPLVKAWVLLSTERQIVDFRQRFTQQHVAELGRASFNVEYFNFYSLYHHLLATAGKPQRCLDDAARFGLIRALLADLYREGEGIFGGIAQTPGFIRIIGTFLYELKENLVDPAAFKAAARTSKEVELADIYFEYQRVLSRHDLVDREGEGWLALDELRRNPRLVRGVDLLIVDGYDQFNPLQVTLLTLLGAEVPDALVTLTTIPGREATIGRRFADALDRLTQAHAAQQLPLDVIPFDAFSDGRQPVLRHLDEQLLRPRPAQIEADAAVYWIEAPDPAREVGALLRRVKRLLLEGVAPDDVLIALRDWTLYGGQVAAQGRVYDLPLALHYGGALEHNPAVVALLDLLSLHAGDFRRRALLDALRSPYFAVPGLGAAQVDLLERISLELRVTGGRADWLDALDLMIRTPAVENDNDDERGRDGLYLNSASVASLKTALSAFFAAVTPPRQGSLSAYVLWLEDLIGQDMPDPAQATEPQDASAYTLDMPACIRAEADDEIVTRDLAAMQTLKQVLRGLLSANALAGSLGYIRQLDRATFLRDLRTAVGAALVERGVPRAGRVLVTSVADARGLPHRHIFIPGLSEGIFPQPAPEAPLLLDSERVRLRVSGVELATQAERSADDGLFYSLIGQARDSLTFSRPHSQKGERWAPSHLWRASQAVFTAASVARQSLYHKLGEVPADPATIHEAALVAADALASGKRPRWVDSAYWVRIRLARDLELRRQSSDPHDHYSGRLRDAELIGWVGEELGENHIWSASQLNEFGLCGFRFFSARLLGLEALEEPEDGMDSRQLGTLYHEILEQTYHRLGGSVTPDRVEEAVAMLHDVADRLMASAPARLRFRVSPQWAQEQGVLRRKLERLVRDDFSGANPLDKHFGGAPREIYRQEVPFGADGSFSIDVGGERLRLRGLVDRIDRQGDRVVVVDYKSGSAPIRKSEIEQGRNFQMLIYLLAAQSLLEQETAPDAPREVAGGVFWQIGGASLGDLAADDIDIIDAGREHLSRYLKLARQGDFAAHASKLQDGKCASYCDFHQFCRVSITSRRKR